MYVCMYVCMYIYIYIYLYVCVYMYVCVCGVCGVYTPHTPAYIYIYIYIYISRHLTVQYNETSQLIITNNYVHKCYTLKFRYLYVDAYSASNNAVNCWGRSTKKSACFPLSIHPLCTTAFFPERVHCILVFLIWEHVTPLQRWVFNSIWPCAHCSTPTHTLILNTHTHSHHSHTSFLWAVKPLT